jgi:hypothetical protein
MPISAVQTTDEAKQAEMRAQLEKACARIPECDDLVILMQRRKGGLLWFICDYMTVERTIFLATALIHYLIERIRE